MVKRVGNYELGKTLGRGTFSKVKLATDITDRSQWAMKVVNRGEVVKEHMESQLKREIAIMKMLKHSNIVFLREVLQTSRNIYIVLELVTGGELFDRIVQAKRFDEETARRFFQQLIIGVEFCHLHGIAHRDLKPENLLLQGDVLKISDFGLSSLTTADLRGALLTTTCGTPNYVAPEVLAEKGYDGMKADIWSCGVILYVMLTGSLPFDDPSLNGLFIKIEKGEFRVPKYLSADSIDLIRKMMTTNPSKRLTVAKIRQSGWFKKGFDASAAEFGRVKEIKDVDDESAMSPAEETEGESALSSRATGGTMNAFDLTSALLAGSLTPLVTGKALPKHVHTTFMASGDLPSVRSRIVEELSKLSCSPRVKTESSDIKCTRVVGRGALTFFVELIPTVTETLVMVEFRRGVGEPLEYNNTYREVYDAVRDIRATTSSRMGEVGGASSSASPKGDEDGRKAESSGDAKPKEGPSE